ncbi:hypothetical protein OK349_19000 [Sphingomonas sp. BT-65]|uniref:hypothetical protein n=1 Tax=Sphingomonas sp. BT-65 TaxID=2989821 RepID=UPI002235E65C|nr:hypothetical protein [Sphingomonas sp. BT-65]MCW4463798.1 hypothetical protein [Sphingomonas sp. BT-65]
MAGSSDLASLKRLTSLCDARHRLAVQAQAQATHDAEHAARERIASESAVTQAQQGWQRIMQSAVLGPEIAAVAGDVLVERARVLANSIDREDGARIALAACEAARREADVRLRQAETVVARRDQLLRRKHEERQLAAIEDRVAYHWRRA